jgi:polar amino acid transport system substrate-binding protein
LFRGTLKANAGLSDEISGDDPPAMNIRKLKADRIDAIIEDSAVMAYTLKREKEQGVKNIGCDPKKIPLYLAFSPKNPKSIEYAAAVDAAVIDLRKSGKLKQILAKYGLKDWK